MRSLIVVAVLATGAHSGGADAETFHLACSLYVPGKLSTYPVAVSVSEEAGAVSVDGGPSREAFISPLKVEFAFGRPGHSATISRVNGAMSVGSGNSPQVMAGSCKKVKDRAF